MIRQSRRLLLVYPLCALILGVVGYVSACQVPVFRYALERWQSDKYELLVISEGPLNTEQAELLHALEQTSRQAAESTFTIQHYDVAETSSSKEAKRIWQEQLQVKSKQVFYRLASTTYWICGWETAKKIYTKSLNLLEIKLLVCCFLTK